MNRPSAVPKYPMSGLNGAAGSPAGGCLPGDAGVLGDRDGAAHRPHGRRQERHVDHLGVAGALPVQERGGDAAGDGHGADRVAERGPGLVDRLGEVGGSHRVGDAGAGPEPERVVPAGVGVGAAVAVARAAHVDDVRVVGPDVVGIDLQLGSDAGHLVGEEDVGDGGEPVEDVAPGGVGEVEPEALLAPVRVLHEHGHLAVEPGDAGRRQPTRGVAAGDVLDLDHLGTPVGEDAGRGGHEGVLGDLEDADAFHHVRHASPLLALRAGPLRPRSVPAGVPGSLPLRSRPQRRRWRREPAR